MKAASKSTQGLKLMNTVSEDAIVGASSGTMINVYAVIAGFGNASSLLLNLPDTGVKGKR
jgi:hypothetical protein